MKNTTESFEELIIPRKDLHISDAMLYRVYSDRKNFELIEAVSALDAIGQSKIKDVYRVERHDPMANNVIHLRQVLGGLPHVENNIPENKIVETPVAQEVVVEPSAPVSEPIAKVEPENIPVAATPEPQPEVSASEAGAALSNDEVDRLLNGG